MRSGVLLLDESVASWYIRLNLYADLPDSTGVHREDSLRKQYLRHFLEVLDHLLPRRLHAAHRDIFGRGGVDVCDDGCKRRPAFGTGRGVNNVRTCIITS